VLLSNFDESASGQANRQALALRWCARPRRPVLPRRLGLIPVRRLLSLLQVLLLLDMSLLQLLGLLLVPLLHLLTSRFIGLPLRHPLVILLLLLLESLVLLLLLRVQLLLLLLVFVVEFCAPSAWRSRVWMGCKILCMHWGRGAGNIVLWSRN
jgi:hypothetical protein